MSNEDLLLSFDMDKLINIYPIAKNKPISEKILFYVNEWKKNVRFEIKNSNPFYDDQYRYRISKNDLKLNNASIDDIDHDFTHFQYLSIKTKYKIDEKFWLTEINKFKNTPKLNMLVEKFGGSEKTKNNKKNEHTDKSNRIICRTLLQEQWLKLLDYKYYEWELSTIEEKKRNFFKKISEWLKLLHELEDVLVKLSLEPGLFFDLSQGNISLTDIDDLRRWASYIKKDEGVKKLCDIMGRFRRAEKTRRQELVKNTSIAKEVIPDSNSKEEIVGIKLGRDIEHVLPQELALLADDETSILFDIKYTEGRLMCFDMKGFQQKELHVEEEVMIEVKNKEKIGPIIICVDTSGSMNGAPEIIAKAVTLFMATRAIRKNRDCFLINFSTDIETLDLSGGLGIQKIINFLQRSFHGGTDASPALSYALELMDTEKYEKSDLLMISDFIMNSLTEKIQNKMMDAKQNSNKFYSLSIGNLFLENKMISIFDNEWVYNPENCSINSLQNIFG